MEDRQDVHDEITGEHMQKGCKLNTNDNAMQQQTAVDSKRQNDNPQTTGQNPHQKGHSCIEFEGTCHSKRHSYTIGRMAVMCMGGMAGINSLGANKLDAGVIKEGKTFRAQLRALTGAGRQRQQRTH